MAVMVGRYVGFLLVIGCGAWIAVNEWSFYGLDALLANSDAGAAQLSLVYYGILFGGPLLCALLEGVVRRAGVFAAWLAFGVLVTAPFAIARVLS